MDPYFPFSFFAAAACAREAKPCAGTLPPFLDASELWIRAAAVLVI